MEIEQKDKSAPAHSIEFVEQKDRYIAKLEAEIKALREALELCRPLVGFSKQHKPASGVEEFEERHNKLLNTIDQLLTKNEG